MRVAGAPALLLGDGSAMDRDEWDAFARAASIDNAMSWITKTGIDGFRLDAVPYTDLCADCARRASA